MTFNTYLFLCGRQSSRVQKAASYRIPKKLPGYASFTLKTNFLRREQVVHSQPGGRYVHVVVWIILPHFIVLLFQSLAQGYDTGTAPEVPMAAKYTPVGDDVKILRHPPPTSISTVTVQPHYSKSTPLMLSCTVYLHICSDSMHLISRVDPP